MSKTICRHCKGTGLEPDRTSNNKRIGNMMREYRLLKKITIREMAFDMGITTSYLSDLEGGRRAWSHKLLDLHSDAILKLTSKTKI